MMAKLYSGATYNKNDVRNAHRLTKLHTLAQDAKQKGHMNQFTALQQQWTRLFTKMQCAFTTGDITDMSYMEIK